MEEALDLSFDRLLMMMTCGKMGVESLLKNECGPQEKVNVVQIGYTIRNTRAMYIQRERERERERKRERIYCSCKINLLFHRQKNKTLNHSPVTLNNS